MKKVLLAVTLLSAVVPAFAAQAFFTGRQEMVQTVTFQTAWNCEYSYMGQNFWRTYKNSCPSTVEVQ